MKDARNKLVGVQQIQLSSDEAYRLGILKLLYVTWASGKQTR